MTRSCLKSRPTATRPPRLRPGLFVDLGGARPIVSVSAGDSLELERLLPLAKRLEWLLVRMLGRGEAA